MNQCSSINREKPVGIIVDTDIGSDCDDAGALAVLHALADLGEANILACLYSSEKNPFGAGCLSAINHYYGRGNIPIGTSKEDEIGDSRNDFLEAIARDRKRFGHGITRREETHDLLSVYRNALATAPDRSVKIVSIGHTKGLHSLVTSRSCPISPLSGHELIKRKVTQWVAMGGEFPRESAAGWNFGANGTSKYSGELVEQWPTPIVFSGYEAGARILTGQSLQHTPQSNPVREAYRLWENKRPSWDQIAVLYAVRSEADYWGLRPGRCKIDRSGRTSWEDGPDGPHAYLMLKSSERFLERLIDDLMASPPKYEADR